MHSVYISRTDVLILVVDFTTFRTALQVSCAELGCCIRMSNLILYLIHWRTLFSFRSLRYVTFLASVDFFVDYLNGLIWIGLKSEPLGDCTALTNIFVYYAIRVVNKRNGRLIWVTPLDGMNS